MTKLYVRIAEDGSIYLVDEKPKTVAKKKLPKCFVQVDSKGHPIEFTFTTKEPERPPVFNGRWVTLVEIKS